MKRDRCRECGTEIQDGEDVAYVSDFVDGEIRYWHKACLDKFDGPGIEAAFRAQQERKRAAGLKAE